MSRKEVINPPNGPPPSGPYSRAVRFENLIFVSGLSAKNSDGTPFTGTIEEEVTNVLDNIRIILDQAGSSINKVLKMTVLLSDPQTWSKMNEVYRKYFSTNPPARTTIISKIEPAKVEMDAIAYV